MCLVVIGAASFLSCFSYLLSSFNLTVVRVMGPVFPLKTGPISSNKIVTRLFVILSKKFMCVF